MRRGAVRSGELCVQPVLGILQRRSDAHAQPPEARCSDRDEERLLALDATLEIAKSRAREVAARKATEVHA